MIDNRHICQLQYAHEPPLSGLGSLVVQPNLLCNTLKLGTYLHLLYVVKSLECWGTGVGGGAENGTGGWHLKDSHKPT